MRINKLGVIMALDALQYKVRPVGAAGAGHTFHSEAIAVAYARQREAETGREHEVTEYQTWR